MTKLPKIPCIIQNHRNMAFQYACMNKLCQENNDQLACLYCCEEFHQSHIEEVIAIKVILNEMSGQKQKKGYNILKILLRGIETCQTYQELKDNFQEVVAYRANPNKFEELIDEEAEILQKNTARFYQRIRERQTKQEVQRKGSQMIKQLISPVLNFKQGANYSLNTPFSVTSLKDELTTIFAYPNLSKFHDSIDVTIKIDRYTPSWLAVGLSIGQAKYEEKSPKHILAISNGWISNKGALQKSKIKFNSGDTVRIKWDKSLELLQFITKTSRSAIRLQNNWNEQIHLCVCLFYKGDSVHLVS